MKYQLYCLGGNETAIITKNVAFDEGVVLAGEIMKKHPEIEQVAIIEDVVGDTCTFRMAGGEFCGNAIRAVAEYMRRNFDKGTSTIYINGIRINATSNGDTSEITLPSQLLLRETKNIGGRTFVVMNGITHVIVPGVGDEKTARDIKDDAEKLGMLGDAFGVMFLQNDKINPFVWVEKAKTFFNETACLSGSIAVAIYLGRDIMDVIQPTNQPYAIEIGNQTIKAGGKVAFLKEGQL